ncbi:hypothetical protein HHI36_010570 [Cryptolaemus montrouzieri]|uniref:Uncharacterized protein n=1 Tax=Cryptolaemus montrouzieri TaxID=559131 RepID=A0ABD2MJ57_9CUCU
MSSTPFATSEKTRLFPKAAPRLENRRSKTKKQLKNIGKDKGKENGKGKGQGKGKGKGQGKEKDDTGERNADDAIDSDCSHDDDTIRLECAESYADSIPGEQWVSVYNL